MNARLPLTCMYCETPLSGGIDTYGNVGQEMCFTCWITEPWDNDEIYTSPSDGREIERLEKKIAKLEYERDAEIEDLRAEIDSVERSYRDDIEALEREIEELSQRKHRQLHGVAWAF